MNDKIKNLKYYTQYLPEVKRYLSQLEEQDLWWTTVAMVGKINNENIDPQLLVSIVETQKEFQHLRDMMIEALITRYLNQANSEVVLKAQATIDMLNRNLFERTADVGFLATDDDLVDYMAESNPSEERQGFIEKRLEEYVAKYTVYEDIALIKPNGDIIAKLNPNNQSRHTQDPILQQALHGQQDYIEVYRHSDIFSHNRKSLIYAKRIEQHKGSQTKTLGVLCLSFRFDQEMALIFDTLNTLDAAYEILLQDEHGEVLASDCPKIHAVGQKLAAPKLTEKPISQNNSLQFHAKAKGYEGFMGLPWYSYIRVDNKVAFAEKSESQSLGLKISPESPVYLTDLEQTNLKVSTLLLIVILNGKITSLKKDVKSFLPILDSFQGISRDIASIFNDFIHHIHNVLIETIQDKVRFSATLACEIMDRNLYERANDCRWWALNSTFRQYLTDHDQGQALNGDQQQELHRILKYINGLYTVYTNLILYDRQGTILAVSDPAQSELVGHSLGQPRDSQACMQLDSTQRYVVSEFETTKLYENRPTYVYHAAVKSWDNINKNVGGIAIVFDSEPQFQAMLADTEPQYMIKEIQQASFSMFVQLNGTLIACTHPDFKPGLVMELPRELKEFEPGKTGTLGWKLNGKNYVVGYQMSKGYREYKTSDGYDNPILALALTPI
jgi:hypothetical protein